MNLKALSTSSLEEWAKEGLAAEGELKRRAEEAAKTKWVFRVYFWVNACSGSAGWRWRGCCRRKRRGGGDTDVSVKTKPRTKRPSLYKVLMLNDDYTPMEFVVYVLQRFFSMDEGRAAGIMMTVHTKGVAVVGVYPFEIAETKVTQVMDCSRSNQHPLQCTMEKE